MTLETLLILVTEGVLIVTGLAWRDRRRRRLCMPGRTAPDRARVLRNYLTELRAHHYGLIQQGKGDAVSNTQTLTKAWLDSDLFMEEMRDHPCTCGPHGACSARNCRGGQP